MESLRVFLVIGRSFKNVLFFWFCVLVVFYFWIKVWIFFVVLDIGCFWFEYWGFFFVLCFIIMYMMFFFVGLDIFRLLVIFEFLIFFNLGWNLRVLRFIVVSVEFLLIGSLFFCIEGFFVNDYIILFKIKRIMNIWIIIV